jgi:hypothetical protein
VDPKKLVADGYDKLYETYAAWTSPRMGHGVATSIGSSPSA